MLTLSLRALLRAPLNVDEELTIRVAQEAPGRIFRTVVDRGGGPFHFWLIHLTLGWPAGLTGLRVPSILFMLAALPAIALVAEELVGRPAAAGAVLLFATAPLAISYSSFARPHSMLLAWLMWGTALGLGAGRLGDSRRWIAAGAVLGSSVFVHPTAPLYAITAFGTTVLYARRPLRAWPGAVALAVTLVPYYATTAHALRDRYGVGAGASGRTFSGRPVWKDAALFVAPGHPVYNWFTGFALVGLGALLYRRLWRSAGVLVLTIAAPVVFFSVVPTSGLSAIFFDRYMLPALPAFLMLVAAGCWTVALPAGRLRLLAFAVVVGLLLAVGLRVVLDRQAQLARLGLGQLTSALRAQSDDDPVLFGSTGFTLPGAYLGYFTFGRPPNLADRYLSLRIPKLELVNDDACEPVVAFLRKGGPPRHGLWVFWAVQPGDERKAEAAFRRIAGIELSEPYRHFLVVRTRAALSPRELVEYGLRLRKTWLRAVPFNQRATLLRDADATALADPGGCRPLSVLGDPDIVPNFPLPPAP